MARFNSGARAAGAGSTTLPSGSIYAGASVNGLLREIGVFNTTTTAVAIALYRLTTTGTRGSALTVSKHRVNTTPTCTTYNTHTVAPTLGNDLGYRAVLGAAAGSGVIWTFGDAGLEVTLGTSNGVGIVIAAGTGQVLDYYFVWDE